MGQQEDKPLEARIATIERWIAGARGANGIEVTGNVFSGAAKTRSTKTLRMEKLIINPTNNITASVPVPLSWNVAWPDATPVTIDSGGQSVDIIIMHWWVKDGLVTIMFGNKAVIDSPLNGNNITITAFLEK